MLRDDQARRYVRNMLLPGVGARGQERLLAAGVLLVGAGGLGSASGYYLAAAGVGRIGIVDPDVVEISNLQRQIAHTTASIGWPKVESMRGALAALNPDVRVAAHGVRLTEANAAEVIEGYDIVLDGSDNFATRFMLNDACVRAGKPLVSGAVLGFEGQVTTVLPGRGHCYRCVFECEPPPGEVPSCSDIGVLGVLPGVIGALEATEALKLILGVGEPLANAILTYDALRMNFRKAPVARDPECAACGGLRCGGEGA